MLTLTIIFGLSFGLNPLYVDLVKTGYYEEAELISGMCAWDSQFFFYKSIAAYKIKEYKKAKQYAEQAHLYVIPERYSMVLSKMLEDIEQFSDDKMADISSDMRMSLERLDLGKGGPKTQKIQAEIIRKLDEKIKDTEDQIKQKAQNQAKAKNQESIQPPSESQSTEGIPEGKIDNKKLQSGGEWGKLPKKDQVKLSSEISRILPNHIREASEGFSKKLQNSGIK